MRSWRKPTKLALCFCVAFLFGLVVLSLAIQAQTWSIHHSFEKNPVAQGERNNLRLTLENTYERQMRIDHVTCYFEWDLYSIPHDSGTVDKVVGSGESYTVSVRFDVPKDIAAKNYGWECDIFYDYQNLVGSWESTNQHYGPYHDLVVNPEEAGIPLLFVVGIVAILAIIVIAVVVLYIMKKPTVHVFRPVHKVEKIEREEPVTRIRPRGVRLRAPPGVGPPETRAVEPGVVPTEVSVPGPSISVRFPNRQVKVLSGETVLGRADFTGIVSTEDARKISNKHLRIYESGGAFYIEDGYQGRPSTNGTILDGRDIRGIGPQKLTPGNTLSLAGIVEITIEEIAGEGAPTMAVARTRALAGPRLVLRTEAGKEFPVEGERVFGRDQLAGILEESKLDTISGKHFRVFSEGPRFFIEDGFGGKSSTNGTFLNEMDLRGKGRAPLSEGDTIRVAEAIKLKVHIAERR